MLGLVGISARAGIVTIDVETFPDTKRISDNTPDHDPVPRADIHRHYRFISNLKRVGDNARGPQNDTLVKNKLLVRIGLVAAITVIGAESWLLAKPLGSPVIGQESTGAGSLSRNTVWTTYHNHALGFSIDYPDDGTYVVTVRQGVLPRSIQNGVEPPPVQGYVVNIGQSFRQLGNTNNFQVLVTQDPNILTSMPDRLQISSGAMINGRQFQKMTETDKLLTSDDYAYATQFNDRYYVFESMIITSSAVHVGLVNPLFEHMMASVIFD